MIEKKFWTVQLGKFSYQNHATIFANTLSLSEISKWQIHTNHIYVKKNFFNAEVMIKDLSKSLFQELVANPSFRKYKTQNVKEKYLT